MPTFQVTMRRQVVTTERASAHIEAATPEEAQQIASLRAVDGSGALNFRETDVGEAEIGDAVVESCTLHAFSEASDAA